MDMKTVDNVRTQEQQPCSRWSDVLARRRTSSDLLWLTFHSWSAAQYKCSKGRDSDQIRNDVFKHPVIEKLLMDSSKNKKKIEAILSEMCHSFSLPATRFVGFFVTKIMKTIYRHVWIDDCIEISKDFPIQSPSPKSSLKEVLDMISMEYPVLLIPTHRSYADFIIFSYLCFDNNLPLPSIAAGIDFLSLNQVASLLRSCGAFFIRRSFKDDSLYWATFTAYVETLIEGGERPMEFFLEGTRSRSGKSLPPKTGLLGVALNLFLTGRLTDLIILPVSISYDRTLEEELYAKELAAPDFMNNAGCGSKPKETTTHLISGTRKILSDDYGSIHLKFASPVSVRYMSNSFAGGDVRRQLRRPGQKSDVRKSFVDSVAKRIINLQVNNLVLSAFPFLSMSVLTLNPGRSLHIFFNSSKILEEVDCLTSLVPSKCLSHRNLGVDLVHDFNESLQVHQKLIMNRKSSVGRIEWPTDTSLDLAVSIDSLTKIQLHHYANQAFQLMIDLAIVCKSSCDWGIYNSIKRLLSIEFIFCESDIESQFNESCIMFLSLTDQSRITLIFHLNFFLESYLNVTKVLLKKMQLFSSQGSQRPTIKQVVEEIQHDLDYPSDLIANAINLMISRSIFHRDDKNSLLVKNESELRKLCLEISSLLNQEVSWQPNAKL